MSESEPRTSPLRGRVVEGVRLIFIALLGTAGFQLGSTYYATENAQRALLFIFLGAGSGFVVGGVVGRLTLRAVSGIERELRRKPGPQILGGVLGLMGGLFVAALLMIPLFFVPPSAAWPSAIFICLVLGSLGLRLGQARYEDMFALIGMKPRAAAATARGDVHVIDTSALIDGRVADLVGTGFISGTILLHEGVLKELQSISDSSDVRRRTRGRRGLDILIELQKAPTVRFELVEEAGVLDVDAALVRLARESGGSLITVDHNLARVAEALRVPVAQINALASKFRVPYAAGDEISVYLVKEGREHGQGVAYLDDGTMVVVERVLEQIGATLDVTVTNVIQTVTGRMVFAAPSGEVSVA